MDDDLIALVVSDATEHMAKAVEHTQIGVQRHPDRAGHPRPRRTPEGRLLRHRDRAPADGGLQRPRGPPPGGLPLRQGVARRDREGAPGLRPGDHPLQRRNGDPPVLPRAHRAAPQGAGQGGQAEGGGRPGGRAQRTALRPARARRDAQGRRPLQRRARAGGEGSGPADPGQRRRRSTASSPTRSRSSSRSDFSRAQPGIRTRFGTRTGIQVGRIRGRFLGRKQATWTTARTGKRTI